MNKQALNNHNFTAIGCVITLIGVLSFLGLFVINLLVIFICLIGATGLKTLLFIPFTIVVWGIWYGVVLVIKAKRTSA